MSSTSRGFARLLLGLAILSLAVVSTDPAAIASRLWVANLGLVVAGVLGLTAMHVVPAIGWRSLVAVSGGTRLPWVTALGLFYSAQAIGGVTPANLGGDLHRAAVMRGRGEDWRVAIAPLIVQRATSYLALGLLSLVALATLAASTPAALPIVAAGVVFSVSVSAVAWLLLAPPAVLAGAHRRLVALVAGTPAGEGEAEDGKTPRLGTATTIGIGSGLAFHAGSIGLTWLLIAAVDASAAGPATLAAVTIARLSLAVPLTPSGIGVQEGALAILLTSVGVAPESALAGLLLARIALLTTTLLGVGLLVRGPRQAPWSGTRLLPGQR